MEHLDSPLMSHDEINKRGKKKPAGTSRSGLKTLIVLTVLPRARYRKDHGFTCTLVAVTVVISVIPRDIKCEGPKIF